MINIIRKTRSGLDLVWWMQLNKHEAEFITGKLCVCVCVCVCVYVFEREIEKEENEKRNHSH